MVKKPHISDEDRQLFRDAMEQLGHNHEESLDDEDFTDQLSDHEHQLPVTPEEIISFRRGGIQNRLFQKMVQGQVSIDAALDLHGHNVEQARQELQHFLHQAQRHHWRYLCIVHGKGQSRFDSHPIMKNKVNNWLRQLEQVLAFHSAIPRHGGTGAVYVLLRS